jgi:hypothetical protein
LLLFLLSLLLLVGVNLLKKKTRMFEGHSKWWMLFLPSWLLNLDIFRYPRPPQRYPGCKTTTLCFSALSPLNLSSPLTSQP